MKIEIVKGNSLKDISIKAADYIELLTKSKIAQNYIFSLALSGGKTPQKLYQILGKPPYQESIPWKYIDLFWSDERFVPKENEYSNYKLANDNLLNKIDIPEKNIHPIPTRAKTPQLAAQGYEQHLRNYFKNRSYLFDLMLLGMGNDGHTASLFPGATDLKQKSIWVKYTTAPQKNHTQKRISLSLAGINQSKQALFLVSGKSKKKVLQEILDHPSKAEKKYPAALIKPIEKLIWFVTDDVL